MTKSETKQQAIALLKENIEIDFPTFLQMLGSQISLRSFYNYRDEVKGGSVPKVQKQVAKARSDKVQNGNVEIDFLQKQELTKLQNEKTEWKAANANLSDGFIKQIDEFAKLQLQNQTLQNEVENAKLQKQELANLQNANANLQNANAILQNDIAFATQEAENQAVANASFGYYAIRFLIAIILIGNFANVYNGIASIESSGFLAILLCTIFATSGFCIMLVHNASAKLKLGVSAICILWESVFASGSIYSNVYKDANRYAKIIDLSSSLFNAEPKNAAIYFAILLSLTICGILYTAIYLITKKS